MALPKSKQFVRNLIGYFMTARTRLVVTIFKSSSLSLDARMVMISLLLGNWSEGLVRRSKSLKTKLLVIANLRNYTRFNWRAKIRNPELFSDVISLKERLIEEINKEAKLNHKKSLVEKSNIELSIPKKFLFIVGHLPGDKLRDSHLRLVVTITKMLASASPDNLVKILVTNEYRKCNKKKRRSHQEAFQELANDVFEKNLFIEYGFSIFNNNYLENVYQKITSFRPDVILRFGGSHESEIFNKYVFDNYPTILIKTNFIENCQGSFDICISSHKNIFAPSKDSNKYRLCKLPIVAFKKRLKYMRDDVKKRKDEITLVSTYGDGRMERVVNTYSSEFIGSMLKILEDYENLRWIFVGASNLDFLFNKDDRFKTIYLQGKIDFIPFENDLRALYEHCDIYVHLPLFFGGGMGVALAVAEKLPVIIFGQSDACNFISNEMIFEKEAYSLGFLKLRELIENQDLRSEIGSNLEKNLREKHSPEYCAEELLLYCTEASALFKKRKKEMLGDLQN